MAAREIAAPVSRRMSEHCCPLTIPLDHECITALEPFLGDVVNGFVGASAGDVAYLSTMETLDRFLGIVGGIGELWLGVFRLIRVDRFGLFFWNSFLWVFCCWLFLTFIHLWSSGEVFRSAKNKSAWRAA